MSSSLVSFSTLLFHSSRVLNDFTVDRSMFNLDPHTNIWQDLTENKTLMFAVGGGIVTTFLRTCLFIIRWSFCFPCSSFSYAAIYIPGFNNRVFYQGPITWEWGLVAAMTIGFIIWCELWKLIRKPLYKRWDYGLVKVDVAGEGGAGTEPKTAPAIVVDEKKMNANGAQ